MEIYMVGKRNIEILVFFLMILVPLAYGQQDAQYTQYMYNTISVNPAYAGSRGRLSATGLYRAQWVGLEGGPRTQTLNFHTPIKLSKIGYGFSVFNDQIGDGTIQETYFDAVVSYTVDVSFDAKLSFGLKLGGNLLNLDFQSLSTTEEEFIGAENIDNKFAPNFGFGVYYHSNRFYAGLSAPNLVEAEYFDRSGSDSNTVNFLSKERINFYLIAGYVFDLNYNFKFKPALLTKIVGGAPLQVDVSANFMYNEKFTFGAAYRWNAALSAMVGFKITEQFMFGLAYDRETTALGGTQFNDGTFEVFLRFELVKFSERPTPSRFF